MFCVVIIFLLVESTAIGKSIQELASESLFVDWVLLSFLWVWENITRDLWELYFGMAVSGTLIFMFSFVKWEQKRRGPRKNSSFMNSPIQTNMPCQKQASVTGSGESVVGKCAQVLRGTARGMCVRLQLAVLCAVYAGLKAKAVGGIILSSCRWGTDASRWVNG